MRCLTLALISLLLGAAISLAVALAAAALRPADGWPNILGTSADQYNEKYFLPQHRIRTAAGDVTIDITGGWSHTDVGQAPLWARRNVPDWVATTYPYPDQMPAETLRVFRNPGSFTLPAWAPPCPVSATEHSIRVSAWGWPWRCLRGTVRNFASYGSDGKFLGLRPEYESFWIRGSGPAGTRFRQVPLGIIPIGLAANAAVFAIPVLGLIAAGHAVRCERRRRRIRRGHCPRCNYDLRTLPTGSPCPECGALGGISAWS
jgi:hypothetical protein